ncbi:hypothetical protein U1Q18_051742, partial [Sarracenia purpurea var. burkii]
LNPDFQMFKKQVSDQFLLIKTQHDDDIRMLKNNHSEAISEAINALRINITQDGESAVPAGIILVRRVNKLQALYDFYAGGLAERAVYVYKRISLAEN